MRNLLTCVLIILTHVLTSQQESELNCAYVKKGRFLYYSPSGGEVAVKRTRRFQKERYNNEKQKFKFKINWISECEYTLTLAKVKGVTKEKKQEIIGKTIRCNILSTQFDECRVKIEDASNSKNELIMYF